MIRYFLARGDRAGSAVITEGLDSVTCSNPPPRVNIATLCMKTYCTACRQEGFIAPKGPRWPGTGPNGMPWALSGDINVCRCNPPPIFYAERGMSMTFTAEEAAALVAPYASSRRPATEDADEDLEHYFEIVDAKTEAPIEGMTYKLSSSGQSLVYDATLSGGRTRAFSMKEHPNLAFVAWREGDVR
ncbi:hypothetical protein FAZ95_31500 [Trinickia violacea]|uniref:PAAR domain-containing protein n=1 Tax=Trinickia violacea TaxID=2571746 RepID=A0A4P8IYQ6_9BURK|nr:hypothetical protein [Trinickia violacea]QCP53567.1 hypothetical protein FAZ95_31500 [Trinickia violacea]